MLEKIINNSRHYNYLVTPIKQEIQKLGDKVFKCFVLNKLKQNIQTILLILITNMIFYHLKIVS